MRPKSVRSPGRAHQAHSCFVGAGLPAFGFAATLFIRPGWLALVQHEPRASHVNRRLGDHACLADVLTDPIDSFYTPVRPVIPVAMGKGTRGVELTTLEDLDEEQVAAWMVQAAAVPGVGGKRG